MTHLPPTPEPHPADDPANPEPSIDDLVLRLAAWMLPGAPPLASPARSESLALVAEASRRQLLGPLVLAVRAGEVELSAEAQAELRERHRAVLWWCLTIESRLLELRDRFEEAGGVDHLVIKGSAVAHLDEADPSLRSFADLDLLVRSTHMDRAVEVLTGQGATRPWPQRRTGYDRRFAKSVTMTGVDGVEVDLHRSLCDGVHGFRIPLDRLFAEQVSYDLGGTEIGALGAVHRVLHAAYHAVLGSPAPRLSSLRDLGSYLARPDLPVAEVAAEAEAWRGTAVLVEAVSMTISALGLDLPGWSEWVATTPVTDDERAIVDRQRVEGSSLGRGKLAALRELRRPDHRIAYAVALGFPSREHLRSRGLRRRDQLRQLARSVR